MPFGGSFHELTKRMDESVDTHLGDRMVLVVEGERYTLVGTHAIEEIVRVTDGGESVVLQRRLSVQERRLPPRLVERGAVIERKDPYADNGIYGGATTVYSIRAVEPEHSGRVRLILGKPKPTV